ncbi:BatD family protein [Mucilaginibacter sp. McL0603]|uniref:BatD family protein n=1 Tax=Mucilaginibacter sp. McL0603 TaxID=3415670 RepID=UPI003CEC7DBE
MKKGFCTILFLLLSTTLLFAADTKFTATVSKSQVGVGEQFEIDFTLNTTGTRFTPPDVSAFQVLSGPNESISATVVNGSSVVSTTYSFILAATKEGTFNITAAAIVVNGHTLTSNPLKIKVQGQAPPQTKTQAQPAPADDNSQVNTKDLAKSLFMRADVSKTKVYTGEQIKVRYKLYTRVDLVANQLDKAPDLNGFWNQDVVNKNPNAMWTAETYNGVKYSVAVIKETVLFAEHSGDLTIDPLAMTFIVRLKTPPRKFMDNPYGNFQDIKYQVKSTPVTVHAAPLPEAGKPVGFSGAVGSFSVYTDIDKKELKANETINYTFEVKGSGNLNLINAPKITPPVDFEKYDPKTTDRITVDSNGIAGSRQFSYLLIPRHQGNYKLDLAKFTYFDPSAKRYITLPTSEFNIKVNKGDMQVNVPVFNSADQQDIKMLGNDIRYIKTSSAGLYQHGGEFYGSVMYYILLLLGPLSFAAAFFYRRWEADYNSDLVLVKSRKAGKVAAKRLADADKQLAAGNKVAFFEAIARGLYGYLSDKLNIPVADLNKETIEERLRVRSVSEPVIKQLNDTMDSCEMARFAPVSVISQQQVFENAKNIINEIEDKL